MGLVTSCTKEEDDMDIDVSKPVLLADKYWQFYSYKIQWDANDPMQAPVEQFELLDQCQRDNFLIFYEDGTMAEFEHRIKCQLSQPDSTLMWYQVFNEDSRIKIWSNPEDPENSIFLQGRIRSHSIDTISITYDVYMEATEVTRRYVYGYVKKDFGE